jgi:hypothetical protein
MLGAFRSHRHGWYPHVAVIFKVGSFSLVGILPTHWAMAVPVIYFLAARTPAVTTPLTTR